MQADPVVDLDVLAVPELCVAEALHHTPLAVFALVEVNEPALRLGACGAGCCCRREEEREQVHCGGMITIITIN